MAFRKRIGEQMDSYKQIFKRKSFHIFKGTERLADADIEKLEIFIQSVKPLDPEIRTKICIVPEAETTCKRCARRIMVWHRKAKEYADEQSGLCDYAFNRKDACRTVP